MSLPAYYPLSFQTAYQNQTNYTNPNGPPATIETPDSAHEGPPESTDSGKTRQCTVRGCTKMISSESGNKMCETCRGRHRTYATTKRAKRKMEKAAVASQSFGHCHGEQRAAIWIAVNPSPNSVVAPRVPTPFQRKINSTGGKPLGSTSTPELHSFTSSSPSSWDISLDPQLFSSQSSELAGALTLPDLISNSTNPVAEVATQHVSTPSSPVITTAKAQMFQSSPELGSGPPPVAAPSSSVPAKASASSCGSLRLCSVKGCKAVIPDEYFFKICEPCRDRYRGYGTTKRAKWKRDRIAVNAELDTLRQQEDSRRATAGLPPLSEATVEEWHAWESSIADEKAHISDHDAATGARMCTVSHCHKILPGYHKYRRCEQHRLQNRYHTKLKRIREKESKSRIRPEEPRARRPSRKNEGQGEKKGNDRDMAAGPFLTHTPLEIDRETCGDGETSESVPNDNQDALVARGIRRTNHVCSIKVCHNLLPPQVPWKMCDICRAHDRLLRKRKRSLVTQISLDKGGADSIDLTDTPGQTAANTIPPGTSDNNRSAIASTVPEVSAPTPPPVNLPPAQVSSSKSDELDDPVPSKIAAPMPSLNPLPIASTSAQDGIAEEPKSPSVLPCSVSSTLTKPLSGPTVPSAEILTPDTVVPKKRGKYKVDTAPERDAMASTSCLVPSPHPHYRPHIQAQYQMPYYVLHSPYGVLPPTRQGLSAPQDASQAYVHISQAPYPLPPYYPPHPPYQYPPYAHPPYPYAHQYLPPPYNAQHSQAHYGSATHPVHPYGSSTNYNGPTTHLPLSYTKPGKRRLNEMVENTSIPRLDTNSTATSGAMHAASGAPSPTSTVMTSEKDIDPAYKDPRPGDDSGEGAAQSCVNKTCHRTIPSGASGILCGRCRTRVKKRQAKTKQRFRLEPRKSIVMRNGRDNLEA